jgi:hypothetical protein
MRPVIQEKVDFELWNSEWDGYVQDFGSFIEWWCWRMSSLLRFPSESSRQSSNSLTHTFMNCTRLRECMIKECCGQLHLPYKNFSTGCHAPKSITPKLFHHAVTHCTPALRVQSTKSSGTRSWRRVMAISQKISMVIGDELKSRWPKYMRPKDDRNWNWNKIMNIINKVNEKRT